MKKALSLLVVTLLILSLSAVCWADSPRPAEAFAQARQFAASLKAELRGDEAAAAAHPGTVTPSYSRTYTRQRTSPLAKAIAAGIIGAFVGLFKPPAPTALSAEAAARPARAGIRSARTAARWEKWKSSGPRT